MTRTWTVTELAVDDPLARELLWRYFEDVASSYHGRPATEAEVGAAMAEDPSDDLVPPGAVFLVAFRDGVPAGCAGVRFGGDGFAELTRVFVLPDARGDGGGAALLEAAERAALDRGMHTIRLDTRSDLVPARRLYTRHGYLAVPAFTAGPYAECWYAKALR